MSVMTAVSDAVRRTGLTNLLADGEVEVDLASYVTGPVAGALPAVEVLDRGVF